MGRNSHYLWDLAGMVAKRVRMVWGHTLAVSIPRKCEQDSGERSPLQLIEKWTTTCLALLKPSNCRTNLMKPTVGTFLSKLIGGPRNYHQSHSFGLPSRRGYSTKFCCK